MSSFPRLRACGAFVYDFVVGDDPVLFVVVCLAVGVTAAVGACGVASWWLLPVGVLLALAGSVRHAQRSATAPPTT